MDTMEISYNAAVRDVAMALDRANNMTAFDASFLMAVIFSIDKEVILKDILEARMELLRINKR